MTVESSALSDSFFAFTLDIHTDPLKARSNTVPFGTLPTFPVVYGVELKDMLTHEDLRDFIARNAQLPWIAQISMSLITRRRTRVPHRERRRRSLGVRLHVAVTARSAAFRGTLGPKRHCAVDFIPRCEAIQPDAVFFYAEVLHDALRTIQTICRELSPPGRFSFGLSQLSFLLDFRLPGQDRSLIVPPSLLLFLSLRELALYFISWTRLHRLFT